MSFSSYQSQPISAKFSSEIKTQLGTLLAFIILFEKKIQQIRIKLAGNEQFHSKLAFSLLDSRKKNIITSADIMEVINRYERNRPIALGQAEIFCKKYSATSSSVNIENNYSMSSHEFLKFLSPRSNKSLSNRLLLRTLPSSKSSSLELSPSLTKLFIQLLHTTITMLTITQALKNRIHSENTLTFLEMLQLIKSYTSSKHKLHFFINQSTQGQGQYDFVVEQMGYLCYYLRENKCDQVEDLTDQEIKEIIMPVDGGNRDMLGTRNAWGYGKENRQFTKTHYFLPTTNPLYAELETNENSDSLNQNKAFSTTMNANFLKTNYKQTYKTFYKPSSSSSGLRNAPQQIVQNNHFYTTSNDQVQQNVPTRQPTPMIYNSKNKGFSQHQDISQNNTNGNLFNFLSKMNPIDNNNNIIQNNQTFISNSIISQSHNNGHFMIEKFNKKMQEPSFTQSRRKRNNIFENNSRIKNIEKFQDDYYINNRSQLSSDDVSRGSAFMQY